MKQQKQSLSLLIASLLLAASVISCGSDTQAPQIDASTASTTEALTTEAVTEPLSTEYDIPEVDYGGETFTIAAMSGVVSLWRAASYCEIYSEGENGDPLNDAIYQRNRKIAETLNVNIEVYPMDDFGSSSTELRQIIQSGEDVYDIALVQADGLRNLLGTGGLVDLYTLPNVDFSHTWWDQGSVAEMTILDKMYTVTGDISLYLNYAPITYFFNKKLVTELALDDPYQLVRDGKWTLDSVISLSKAAAADLNGDGVMSETDDRYGMLSEPGSLTFATHAAGVSLTDKDADGLPVLNVDVERAAAVSDLFAPFMRDTNINLMNVTVKGSYGNPFTELFLPMFTENRALFYNNQLLVALNLRDMEADFGILPAPKLDEAQENYHTPFNDWWGTFLIMPVTNTNYEMTGHVIEALGYWGQQLVKPAYMETTISSKALRDEASLEMLDIIFDNRIYDLATLYNWNSIDSFSSDLANSSQSYASRYAKIEKSVTKSIEKTIEQLKAEE